MKEEKRLGSYGQTDEPTDNSGAYQKSVTSKTLVSPPEHFKSETKSLAQKMKEEKRLRSYGQTDEPTDNSGAYLKSVISKTLVSPLNILKVKRSL